MNYLIGYFSRRQVFHIVAYRDNMEEVEAFLKTHPSKLVVFGKISRPTPRALDSATPCPDCGSKKLGIHSVRCSRYRPPSQ